MTNGKECLFKILGLQIKSIMVHCGIFCSGEEIVSCRNEMKELSGERRLVFFHGSEVAMRGCKKRRALFVHFRCCCVCFCVSMRVAKVLDSFPHHNKGSVCHNSPCGLNLHGHLLENYMYTDTNTSLKSYFHISLQLNTLFFGT